MNRIYHHYEKWECYKNGMWIKTNNEIQLNKAIEFTSNYLEYGKSMNDVINYWFYSCENFLSNKSINRKAYLGHCAVSFKFKISENITRLAWKYLTKEQQDLANNEAENNIKLWEQKKKSEIILINGKKDVIKMEYQMKLQLN